MQTRTRTRLSPENRKKQILEAARNLITSKGIQSFTMDSLAAAAGITTPLVYNYFANRSELLQALLKQEYTAFSEKVQAEVESASSFEETVRAFILSNFDHFAPGSILPVLQSQPEVAVVISEQQKRASNRSASFLVRLTAKSFQLTRAEAELVMSMSSGASIAAAQYASTHEATRDETVDKVLAYVIAGLGAVASIKDKT
jgi:AcrR family transcriptional regulator